MRFSFSQTRPSLKTALVSAALSSVLLTSPLAANANSSAHPHLLMTPADTSSMQAAIGQPGAFQSAYLANKKSVDARIQQPIEVPTPADAGGGYTHEKHKKNYKLIYDAGTMFQLTGEAKYADYARDMLLAYAAMYRDLPLHPMQKEQSPGKLFWQSLNEAVWLVYSIQGYDAIASNLTADEKKQIEDGVLRPMALYLSEESPQTFNKVHNHGTWATAAVGMTGYVIDEPEWVEKALYGLDKSGDGGFMRQLEELFSPQGYYNEGPYYQRYALMPFVMFAKAIDTNQPKRKIFEFRDSILLKAINTTIDLSYNGLFFPINDALKDKGIDTIELVFGVAIAYGITGNSDLLSIAKEQNQILLTSDGLAVAKALDANKQTPYPFKSLELGDGADGQSGSLLIMRANQQADHQALVFKTTSQGMNHGHFDKLNWLFYDNGEEIVTDYGAARFLNVEAKYGGHYLKENNTYAKQTVAHNTLVVDQVSHFKGKTKTGNKYHPEVHFFATDETVTIGSATMKNAYDDVEFTRTQALVNSSSLERPIVFDVMTVDADDEHQYDLPLHYNGHLMATNFDLNSSNREMKALGKKFGYQHLWLKAKAEPEQPIAKITWLNEGRFYTHSTITTDAMQVLFTQTGANDPNFNLRHDDAFILRSPQAESQKFVSVLELHGEYNPSKEFTVNSHSQLSSLNYEQQDDVTLITATFEAVTLTLAYVADADRDAKHSVTINGQKHTFSGPFKLVESVNKAN